MKRKWPVVLMAGVMALGAGAMSACGKTGKDGTVTIEFYGWGDAAEQENYQTLVDKFMEENENIIVDYNGDVAANYMTTLEGRATNLPDLFYMPDYEFLYWASSGVLKDITSYVSEDELSKLWPQAVDEYYYNPSTAKLGKSSGAKLYGLPKDLGPFTLVYNKDLVDRAIEKNGLNREEIDALLDPETPMTWAQFRDLLKMLDKGETGDDRIYGVSHYEIEAAVYSNGANFFTDDAATEKISSPEFYEAIQFIANLDLVDHVMPSADNQASTNGYQRFKSGKCYFSFMGPWDCAEFWQTANFRYDILPVPYNGDNPEAKSTAWIGSMAYCISKKSNDAKTEAALKLAKYLCYNEEAQREFYKLGQQVPNITSMANEEYINDTQGALAADNHANAPTSRSVWVDTINGFSQSDKIGGKVRARYYTYQSQWYTDLTDYFGKQGLWTGTKTAEEVCKAYASTFQNTLDEMKSKLG